MPHGDKSLNQHYSTALVTGASSGIGQAVATQLIETGLRGFGTTRQPGKANLDPAVQWLPLDGSSMEGISAFLEAHGDLLTSIDILINNAGSSCFGKASEIPPNVLSAQQSLLFETPVQLTRAALAGMEERHCGAIVNVSSLAALFPLPYMEGYSAGKAALSTYSQGLMLTLKESGVVVIDFQAGDYNTAFNDHIRRYGEADDREARVWKRLEENIAAAPVPALAARDMIKALERRKSGIIRSGGFFQKQVAPLGARLLPRRVLLGLIRRYYNLPG